MEPFRSLVPFVLGGALAAQILPPPPAPDAPISEYVRHVFEDRDGHLWLGTNGEGVVLWDGKTLSWLGPGTALDRCAIRGIVQDGDGAMWFATERGVVRWHSGAATTYTTANGLAADDCWSLFRDRDGTIWVGTMRGVCRLVGKRWEPFPLPAAVEPVREARFAREVVWDFAQAADGSMWFATDGDGLRRWDGKVFTAYTQKDGIGGDCVRTCCVDRNGRVWAGSDGGGLACFDGKAWRRWTDKDGLGNDRIFVIVEASDGALWISTLGAGLARWDGTKFTQLRETDGRTRNHVQSILQAKDGTMWFGFSGGLYRLAGERLVHVTKDGPWR